MAVIHDKKKPRKAPDTSTADGILRALVDDCSRLEWVWCREAGIGRTGLQVDLFAIKPSWHPMPTVFEVKSSRSDFKRDEKWQEYLPYCQRMYFAAPAGILSAAEIPSPAGLVECYRDGTLRITKPARVRTIRAKDLQLMLNRLLFRYMFPRGGKIALPHEWDPDAEARMSRAARHAAEQGANGGQFAAGTVGDLAAKERARQIVASMDMRRF